MPRGVHVFGPWTSSRAVGRVGSGFDHEFDGGEVFFAAVFEDLVAFECKGPDEVVHGIVAATGVVEGLAEAEVDERVLVGIGAVQRVVQRIDRTREIIAEIAGIADSGEEPRGSFPLGLWRREECQRCPIEVDGLLELASSEGGFGTFAQCGHLLVEGVREFLHGSAFGSFGGHAGAEEGEVLGIQALKRAGL